MTSQYVLKKMTIKASLPRERDLALQEARLMAKLKHPNVVTYKDCFIEKEIMYICMGFCEGGDLHARSVRAYCARRPPVRARLRACHTCT